MTNGICKYFVINVCNYNKKKKLDIKSVFGLLKMRL